MKAFRIILILSVFIICSSVNVLAAQPVGIVKSVSGNVYLQNGSSSIKAIPHMRISQGDRIVTEANSSVGLIFEDDTVVSLGPKSDMIVEEFLFNPAEKKLSFVARMVKGTFSFISGQITKLAPKQVRLETPDATLGVRGTKVLVKID